MAHLQRLRELIDNLQYEISRAQTHLQNILQNCDRILTAHTSLSLIIRSVGHDVELSDVNFRADRGDVERLTQIIIAANHVDRECSICTEPFQVGEDARQMPCHESHIFHAHCLLRWLESSNSCPICRTRITNG
ncbi:probable E3 ubiquitin-protein ligase RHC1A [Cryptomeria japonica]|uniref:probable E3 ubiquitin-protein ligase RHC1A n=1 Tax=Cryptomeria japonica TaxID=3369 RepID=UPI0027DA18DB|nr:probable E3 ubiquitin-protein ligase RHC1A [Cryptomeria japonica]